MEANETPEKIYISNVPSELGGYTYITCDKNFPHAVEYTRTDAFIEKVLDYIENNIYDHYDGDHEYGVCGGFVKKEEFIKNIKGHMKGE